ncbi:MAG: hypothetical protein GY835_16740 [bacterium]|nr:hypothetical protein [bacterium]
MIGIGVSNLVDSFEAGIEIAREAKADLGDDASPQLALAMIGGAYDIPELLRGIRSELGDIPITGGAATGIISREYLGYSGTECSLMLFSPALGEVRYLVSDPFAGGEELAGEKLGREIAACADAGSTVFLLYDTKEIGAFNFPYHGSRLLNGIYSGLGDEQVTLLGARVSGDINFTNSFVLDGKAISNQIALAIILPGTLKPHTRSIHGCLPASRIYEVTRAEGNTVYELDNRPVRDVVREITGFMPEMDTDIPLPKGDLSFLVTFGCWMGEETNDFSESAFMNRLVISSDSVTGSVRILDTDLHVGTKVQIMARDSQAIMDSTRAETTALLAEVAHDKVVFASYIDCGGRTAAVSATDGEEADIVRSLLPLGLPLFGFYTGGELGPTPVRSHPLDWTGVLTLFTYEPDGS